ncbi:MAG: hypothetical protein ACI865_001053 [Flavobacteriaceae bacterium]|jgi:uncharacterized protein (DUF2141 family)
MKFFLSITVLSILFICGSFCSLEVENSPAADFVLTIHVKNIRNKKGRIQFQVYRSQKAFAAEKPWKQVYSSKAKVKDKSLTFKIHGLKAGVYGVALLDDENSDKKMDYSWLIPSEGFGFSGYYHTAWSKPKFHQFKFSLSANKKVTAKVRYM